MFYLQKSLFVATVIPYEDGVIALKLVKDTTTIFLYLTEVMTYFFLSYEYHGGKTINFDQ